MSVTFRLVGTPYVKYKPFPEDDPEFEDEIPEEGWFELNMSYINVKDLLMLMNRPKDARDQHGQWDVQTCASLLERVARLRSIEKSSFLKETVHGSNFVEIGRNESYVDRKLEVMYNLLKSAVEKQLPVYFS